jgi:hypothetical protein
MKKKITKNVTLSKETFWFILQKTNEIIENAECKINDLENEKLREKEAKDKGIEYKIYDFYFEYAEHAKEDLKNYMPLREMLLGIYDFESEV